MLAGMDTDSAPLTWATFLKDRRTSLDLTQEQLAIRSGLRQSDISRWERGYYVPPTKVLGALAEALEITGDELLALTRSGNGRPAA
jgi:transcriptional regulator with XRE-family HTH domain